MKLFLDDVREPEEEGFEVVRSFDEAVDFIKKNGIPEFISFDHDLGKDENGNEQTGYDFAKFIVEMDMNGVHTIPDDFQFNVHSANPVGRQNIHDLLIGYIRFKNKNFENY